MAEIYIVGGCVRDHLLGKKVSDMDYVVVGSTPEKMIAAGFKQVGADFPVFLHPETQDEYALARTERKVGQGYAGFETNFGTEVTLCDDLFRRDLTINSIAFDGKNYIDPLCGMEDLKNKILRHSSEAFREDPLRVIRLARFYNRFTDFRVDPQTLDMCMEMVESGELDTISYERFWGELEKVFTEDSQDRFIEFLYEVGAVSKVRFFRELFGATAMHISRANAQIGTDLGIPVELRLPGFLARIATYSNRNETMSTAKKEHKDIAKLYVAACASDFTFPKSVVKFLVQAGVFHRDNMLDKLYKISPALWHILHHLSEAAKSVDTEELVRKYSGKELGEKILEARENAVEKEMKRNERC